MGDVVKFPDIEDRRWESIKHHVFDVCSKNNVPAVAHDEIMAWIKDTFEKNMKTPSVELRSSEEAKRFIELLERQKNELFLEAVKLLILACRA